MKITSGQPLNSQQRSLAMKFIFSLLFLGIGLSTIYVYFNTVPLQNSQRHCASNLKSIGFAMHQYAQDYDGTLPRSWFGREDMPSDAKTNYKWMDAIFPYAKAVELFDCPAKTGGLPYRFRSGINGSYVMNNAYYAPDDSHTPPAGMRLSEIKSPSSVVLVTDGTGDFQFAWSDAAAAPSIIEGYPRTLGTISGRHKDNVKSQGFAIPLYADGHILGNSLEYVSKPKQNSLYAGFTIEDD